MSRHLKHDTALALAMWIVAEVSPCVPDQARQKQWLQMFYDALMQALERYDEKAGLEVKRLARPSPN